MAAPVLGLLLLSACSAATPPAATIAGEDLTDAQLAREMDVFTFLADLSQQPCGTKDGPETQDAACARFALTSVIRERFATAYARQSGITVTDADIAPLLQNLDQQVGKKKVDRLLAQNGLTRTDLAGIARRSLLLGDVRSAVTEERVTDAGLRQLYDQSILDYTTIQVDQILVKTKAEADQVYAQVTAPGSTEQDFQALARQVSIDPSAAQNGGSLGAAVASGYVRPFAEAAAVLEPGQISQPVRTKFGWHVIRMVSKQVQSFAQAKQALIDSRSIVEFNAWLREQVKSRGVEVNPRYGRFDLQSLEVTRISSTATGSSPAPSASASASASA